MSKTVAQLREERARRSGTNTSSGNAPYRSKTVKELRAERTKKELLQIQPERADLKSYVAAIPYKWEGAVTPSEDIKAKKTVHDYVSKYNNTTTYDDIQNDIKNVEMYRAGAQRRGKDTKQYDYILDSIKRYKNNLLSTLDSNDVSVANRKAVYNEYTDRLNKLKANRLKTENDIRNDNSLSYNEKVSKAQSLNDEISDLDAIISAYERSHQKFIDEHYGFRNDSEFEKYAEMGAGLSANLTEDQPRFTMSYLTDDEQKSYNYFLAKYGNDAAEQYYKYIENNLNKRTAEKRFEEEYEGKTGKELAHKVISGFDNFETGVGVVFNPNDSSYINPSYNKYLSALTREDLKDDGPVVLKGGDEDPTNDVSLGQVAGDLIETISNQAIPLVAAGMGGTASSAFGTALLGLSAGGSSYADMINGGYNKKEASNYATLIGASEATLQYLLGGISKLSGGKTLSNVVASKIKNGLLKASLSYGGNIASEFTEEALQEVLAPVFKGVVTGEEIEHANLDDVIYAGVLGALSAGVMESPNAISDSVAGVTDLIEASQKSQKNKAIGKQISTQGNAEIAINKALNLPDTENNRIIKKLARDIQDQDVSKLSKKGLKEYNKMLGQLYNMLEKNSVSEVVNSSDGAVKDFIKGKLSEYGVTERVDDIASAIYKEYIGQDTNDIDKGLIKSNHGEEIITYMNDHKSEVDDIISNRIIQSYTELNSVKELTGIDEMTDIDIEDFNFSDDGKTYVAGTSDAVEVGKIETISKDDIVVSLSDGSKQSIKNLDLGSSEQAVLYQGVLDIQTDLGVKLDTNTANALITAYNNMAVDAKTYVMDAKVAIMKGYANVGANTLKTNVIGNKARIIYDLGVRLSENETTRRKNKVAKKVAPKTKSTVTFEGVDKNTLSERQRVSVNAVEKLAETTGVNFVFFKSEKKNGKFTSKYDTKNGSPNGFYKASTNTVYLDINAGATGKGTILFTAAHELTHAIREWSPESFKTFADFLAEKYTTKGEKFDALIRAKMNNLSLTYDEAYEEVVADSCESFLVDSNLIENVEELSKKDMNLANKIKDFLKNLLQKVREVYKKLSPDSYEGRYVREMRDSLSELHGKWIQGIKNATENLNNASTATTKNTANNDGVRYSTKIEFAQQVDDVLNNNYDKNNHVYMGNTPQTLVNILGINKLPMLVTNNHIYSMSVSKSKAKSEGRYNKNVNYHNLGDTVKELPELLNKPVMIIKSNTNADDTTFVVVTNKVDTNDNPILAVIKLDGKGFYYNVELDSTVLLSAYGKDKFSNYLAKAFNDNRILYLNKNSQQTDIPGVQFPNNVLSADYSNNLARFKQIVNNNSMQKDRKNSHRDTQYLNAVNNGDMETAQRMVEEAAKEAGYTIKAYHGTKYFGFTKFDLSEARDAKAVFLTDSEDIASSYSGITSTREISDAFTDSLDGMTAQQLVSELNKKEYVTSDTPYIRYFLYNDMIVRDLFNGYIQTYVDIDQAKTDLVKKRSKGNYALYVKPDNMLTIDCKGVEYDEITGWNDEAPKQKGTTDDVARYAFEKGYDGVAMENLIDNGGANSEVKANVKATVYAVFNPSSIKSSDTVTYDDNGDIIPLSKRFDMSNEDIRYSQRLLPATVPLDERLSGDDLLNAQDIIDEIQSVGGMVDEYGNAVLYHGTNDKSYSSIKNSGTMKAKENGLFFSTKKDGIIKDYGSSVLRVKIPVDNIVIDDIFDNEIHFRLPLNDNDYSANVSQIMFSQRDFKNALSSAEWKKYNYAMISKVDAGLRITDHSILVECEDGDYSYKLVVYDNESEENNIAAIYGIGENLYNDDISNFDQKIIGEFITELEDRKYDNKKVLKKLLRNHSEVFGYVFGRYNIKSKRYDEIRGSASKNRATIKNKPNRTGVPEDARQGVPTDDRIDGKPLYQPRPDFSDVLFYEYSEEVTDDDARLITAYLVKGQNDVFVHLINTTRATKLSDEEVNRLVRRLFDSYDLSEGKLKSEENIKNVKNAVLELLDSKTKAEIKNNIENLHKNFATIHHSTALELTARMIADVVQRKQAENDVKYIKDLVKMVRRSHNERVRKVRADTQLKTEWLVKERENAKYDRLVEKHKKQRETYAENRNKTDVRNKIRNRIKQLDSYLNHGNNKKNVKEGMRDFVSKALETADIIFSNDISNDDILKRGVIGMSEKEQKYYDRCREYLQMREAKEELYAKAREKSELEAMRKIQSKIDEINKKLRQNKAPLRDLFAREKAKLYEVPVKDALNSLADEYAKIENSETAYVSNAYDEDVLAMINDLKEKIGDGTRARDMTLEQLVKVHDVYTAVLSAVRNANKLFLIDNSVSDTGEYIREEVKKVKKARSSESGALRIVEKFGIDSLKPIYFFRLIGSETFEKLYWNLQQGELKWYQNVSLVKEFRKQIAEKYNYTSWDFDKLETFKDVFGNEFSLSLEEKMSLCALYRREQGREHLLRDGFVFDENVKIKGDRKGINANIYHSYHTEYKAHRMSVNIVTKIYGTLTAEQKAYMEDMQKYLSTDMSALGNEVSMKLYGIKQFREAFYYPIKVSRKHLKTDPGKMDADAKLKSSGFTHNTVPKSGNPIVLGEFSTIWAEHCNRMCQYNAFVLPLEDLTKVLNYRVSSATRNSDAIALKSEISARWGNGAERYIEKLIRDLNGSVRAENIEVVDKLISLTKKGSVMASASVTIQQPFAMYRALSLISPKYYPKAMVKGLSFKNHNSEFEELKKYAPVAGIKEMGYFDVGIGQKTSDWMLQDEYKGKDKVKAFFTDSGYRDDVLSIPPAKADEVAWFVIWRAVKSEIKDTTNLTGEEYFNRCGQRFNEIIHLTQVYDSVLSRSGLMRNKDAMSKAVTAFMAEPTVTMNMMVDSLVQAERLGAKQGFKAGFGGIARVYSTIAFTQVITALFKSLVLAGRDDDEDETYLEKYISAATKEVLQSLNPIGWIPVGRDVLSIIQGYDIERTDMSLIGEFIDSIKDLNKTLSSDDSSGKQIAEDTVAVLSSFSNFFGVPVKNFLRDVDTVVNIAKTFTYSMNNDINSYDIKEAVKEGVWNRSTKKVERAKKAYDNGDMEIFHDTISDMIQDKVDDGKTEKEARSSVRAKFTSQCKSEYLKLYVDERNILEANEIRKYLLATGLYGNLSELDKDLFQWRKDYNEEKNKKLLS